jgi:hypothetical protein
MEYDQGTITKQTKQSINQPTLIRGEASYTSTETMYTTEKQFPNGFASWHETHFEIVQAIASEYKKDEPRGKVKEMLDTQGYCGLYELAQKLTDTFEWLFLGAEWGAELDWSDQINAFIKLHIK